MHSYIIIYFNRYKVTSILDFDDRFGKFLYVRQIPESYISRGNKQKPHLKSLIDAITSFCFSGPKRALTSGRAGRRF